MPMPSHSLLRLPYGEPVAATNEHRAGSACTRPEDDVEPRVATGYLHTEQEVSLRLREVAVDEARRKDLQGGPVDELDQLGGRTA